MGADRIQRAFQRKAFISFVTGGDPSLEDTRRFVNRLAAAGADLIEIGVPFSDPVAEGPVIQAASQRALRAGATPAALFELVRTLRVDDGLEVPLALMTYLNPVHHIGYDDFFRQARQAGVDALIIPDLPFEEHGEVRDQARRHDVALISMIAPTSAQRIRQIAAAAEGFIYLVSSLGVTGVRSAITTDIAAIVSEIRRVSPVPVAVGFGIATEEQAAAMARQADGVIVGSALVSLIEQYGDQAGGPVEQLARRLVSAIR